MKTRILQVSILLVFVAIPAFSQYHLTEFGMNYSFSAPSGSMKNYITNANGFTMDFGFTTPSNRLVGGLELNCSNYGHVKDTQLYTFPDGMSADMIVTVNNTFTNIMGVTRLYLKTTGVFRPYVSAKAGYSAFTTRLVITDPNDQDSCEPVDSDLLQHDGTFAYSFGGGLRVDMSSIFKRANAGRTFLDLSSNVLQGGKVNYMNTDAPPQTHAHSANSTRTSDLEVEFINTQTKVVHMHHVGYVYNSFVQLVDVRLGLALRLDTKGYYRRRYLSQ